MPNIVYPVIALALIVVALFFIRKNYRHLYRGYKADWSDSRFILKLVLIFIKTCISLIVIIILHNFYHTEQYVQMIILAVAFMSLAIFQSSYARIGFFSRCKFIANYVYNVFKRKKNQAKHLFENLENDEFNRYIFVVKILLLIILFFIFLSQISFFIITNLYYVVIVSSFILLSFILNSLIYFGFTSLVLLQTVPNYISFSNLNLYILSLAFVIVFIGMLFDRIFSDRICIITGNYYIKDVDFDAKYIAVHRSKRIIIYQNKVNKQYYLHYRTVGYVIAFESYYNAKEYRTILNKMIRVGKRFLIKNKEDLKMWL